MEQYSMIEECAERYCVVENPDGSIRIEIDISKRFKNLWMEKLTDWVVTEDELKDYLPAESDENLQKG